MHKLLELLYSSGIVFRDAWHHKGAGRTGVSTKMKAGMQNGAGSASPTFFVTTFPSQPLAWTTYRCIPHSPPTQQQKVLGLFAESPSSEIWVARCFCTVYCQSEFMTPVMINTL